MTREERVEKLRCLITCMKCEVSGKVCDDNCPTQYDSGNMREIIENLEEIAKALEQEPRKGHWIMTSDYLTTAYGSIDYVKCSCCGEDSLEEGDYCPNCGADMREVEE